MNNTKINEKTKKFLLALANAHKMLQLYPPYNPIPTAAVEQAFELMNDVLKNKANIYLQFSKNQISDGKDPICGSETEIERLNSLSRTLIERGISSIIIFEGASKNELLLLLTNLLKEPEELMQLGGISKILEDSNITHIKVNEIPKEVSFNETGDEVKIEEAVKSKENYLLEILSSMLLKEDLTSQDLKLIEHLLSKPKDLRAVLTFTATNGTNLSNANINLLETVVKRLFELIETKLASPHAKENLISAVVSMPATIVQKLVISMLFSAVRNDTARNFLESFSPDQLASIIIAAHDSENTRIEKVGAVLGNVEFSKDFHNALSENLLQQLVEKGYSIEESSVILGKEEAQDSVEEEVEEFESGFTSFTGKENQIAGINLKDIEQTPQDQKMLDFLIVEAKKFRSESHIARSLFSLLLYVDSERSAKDIKRVLELIIPSLTSEGDFSVLTEALLLLKKIRTDENVQESVRQLAKELISELSLKKYIYQAFEVLSEAEPETSKYKNAFLFLSTLPRETVIQGLVEILSTEEMLSRRKLLINILSKLGADSVKIIGERILPDDERWYLVRNLVTILGNIKTEECVEYIKNALRHSDFRVRKEAVKALASIGGDQACEAIIEIYDEQEPEFKLFILKNIGATESGKAFEILSPIVEKSDRFLRDIDWKLAAIESLSMLPFAESRIMLQKLAQTRSFFFRRRARKIAASAQDALIKLNSRMKKVVTNEGSAI